MARTLPDEALTPLGRAIRDMGLTVKRASELCGVHHKTMAGYCKAADRTGSRIPSKSMLGHICRTLKLDPEQFEHGQDQRNGYYLRPAELLGMDP